MAIGSDVVESIYFLYRTSDGLCSKHVYMMDLNDSIVGAVLLSWGEVLCYSLHHLVVIHDIFQEIYQRIIII